MSFFFFIFFKGYLSSEMGLFRSLAFWKVGNATLFVTEIIFIEFLGSETSSRWLMGL